jgi:hypothetical protein
MATLAFDETADFDDADNPAPLWELPPVESALRHVDCTNARGVFSHSPRIDPGVRYPPYSEHQRERTVESWVT